MIMLEKVHFHEQKSYKNNLAEIWPWEFQYFNKI